MKSQPIADFFDRECCALGAAADEPDDELDSVSLSLLAAVERAGIGDATVLELGSGDGALSRELLRRGAATVTGVDLSPQSVRYAAERAAAAGLAGRADYRAGDAAEATLELHDVVLSNRVFCCYPNAQRLLDNTLPAARLLYLLALPDSRGLIGIGARLVVALANAWQRLRRDPFRGHVHDVQELDERVRLRGWRQAFSERHRGWLVLGYARAPTDPA